ncbi:MAG TPA: hypothetical protein VGR96_10180 [Acidobacteriaceae bacterium]|nr:hypothetical protein [Acidobacteriaceae bacterium]
MRPFSWLSRLKYAALAGVAGWLAGVALTIPFEYGVAQRYVNGNAGEIPRVLAEGLLVWSAFTFFIAFVAWVPLVLPVLLLVPPAWLVRWRRLLVPCSVLVAGFAMGVRLNLFQHKNFVSEKAFLYAFGTAPYTFSLAFALVLAVVYVKMAARRLARG